MKLKGLVWFFAITLILISIYQLSFTWVVNSYEAKVKQKAEKIVKMTHPGISADERDDLVTHQLTRMLDSAKDAKIYPVFGTSYLKCKENELNLGLDLQGGMNVTLNVDLEGVIKSLSNNPKDPQLLNALNGADAQKAKSDLDYISLFGQVFKQQNPSANLSSLFAGVGKTIKIGDNDQQVLDQLETISKNAINQTYKILSNRVDQFGVAQTSTNLEVNKGIITVELPGVQDATRVRKLLQASAHLQFWEVYNIDELKNSIENADKALGQYLNGTKSDTTKNSGDTTANKADTSKLTANDHPLADVIHLIGPKQDKNGKHQYSTQIENI
jgi:SecD/SecF fusion protein